MLKQQTNQQKYIFTGTIVTLIRHDPKTGYSEFKVLRCKTPRRTEYVAGYLPAPYLGIKMRFLGEWGFLNGAPIFHADVAYELQPKTPTEIRKYLRSGILNGIDDQIIKNMVRYFKEDTVNILDKDTERLAELEGVSKGHLSKIIYSWLEHKHIQETMAYLQQHGLIGRFAVQAYKLYGGFTREKIQENPYRLLQDLKDIRFADIDQFALYLGMLEDGDERIMAGISYILSECQASGHCYLTERQICKAVNRLLDIDISEDLQEILHDMHKQQLVKIHELTPKGKTAQTWYYDPFIYDSELYVARKISRNNIPPEADLEWIEDLVKTYRASERDIKDEQLMPIIESICSKYSVLTGGPGTGKYATLKAIIYILKKMALKFHLVSPTIPGAQRLSERTGENAQTIHNLLTCKTGNSFEYDEKKRFDTDFLIINESSMLDICLLAALLHAAPDTAQFLFVGDSNQLPSMVSGNVLKDFIESKAIPVFKLTQPFRDSADTMTIRLANQLKMGLSAKLILSEIERVKSDDMDSNCFFFFSEMHKQGLWEDSIRNFVNHCPDPLDFDAFMQSDDESKSNLGQKNFAIDFIHVLYQELNRSNDSPEIQILAPTHQTSCLLNQEIQNSVNPYDKGKQHLRIGNKVFRIGDRVVHCQDNYGLGVYSGEIGKILQIGDRKTPCSVGYSGDRIVDYNHDNIKALDLAYAFPITKNQGYKFDVVIIPLMAIGFSRHMLYTAITRAKKLVVFVGDMVTFSKALENGHVKTKQTGLKHLFL